MKDQSHSRLIAVVAVLAFVMAAFAGASMAAVDDSDAADPDSAYVGQSYSHSARITAAYYSSEGVTTFGKVSLSTASTQLGLTFSGSGGVNEIPTATGSNDRPYMTYTISGTPDAEGTAVFSGTFSYSNTVNGAKSESFSISVKVVSSGSSENPISFTSPAAVESISGSSISYQATTNIAGTEFSATGYGNAYWLTLSSTGKLSGTVPSVTAKTVYSFSILATSPGGQSATQKVSFEVFPVAKLTSTAMTVSGKVGAAIAPVTISSNIVSTFGVQAVSGSLADLGLAFDASAGTITGTPTKTGNAVVKILGYTTEGPSQTASIEVSVSIGEDDLSITSSPPTGIFRVGSRWTYEAKANQEVTWTILDAPGWLGVSGSTVSGQVDGYTAPDTVTFTLKATTAGGQYRTQSVSISVEPALQFTSVPTAACSVTPIYSYSADGSYSVLRARALTGMEDIVPEDSASSDAVSASPRLILGDAAINYTAPTAVDAITGSKLTYNATTNITGTKFSKVSGDSWLSITSAGVVSGTAPAVTAKKDYTITIKATSPQNQTIQQVVTISVYPVAKLTSSSLSASVNQNARMTDITVTSNVAVTWSKSGDLPAGVTFSNGKISGTPTAQGTFTVTIYGATTAGPSQTASVKISITVGEPVLSITSSFPTSLFLVGKTYTYTPTTNVSGSTFSVTGAPSWLGVASGKVTGQVTGYTDATTVSYTLKATSPGGQTATQSVKITVEPVIAWTSIPTASCIVMATYTYADDGSYTLKTNILLSNADIDPVPLAAGIPLGVLASADIPGRASAPAASAVIDAPALRCEAIDGVHTHDSMTLGDDSNLPSAQNADITETGTRTFEFLWTGENAERVHWDFGDGTTAEGMKVVHTYASNGVYEYTCTGINSVGSSSVTGRITVAMEDDGSGIPMWAVLAVIIALCIVVAAVILVRRRSRPTNMNRRPGRGF